MEEVMKNETLCSLCEEFSADALNYLSENKTQTEITEILHKTCGRIPTFNKQCIALVDYYAPLFFTEVSSIEPDGFCQKFGLCEEVISFPLHLSKNNTCDACHNVVAEALLKLKDPDTELEVVELLLKACNSLKNNVKKCKRLVFEYAPIILVNAEKFLETNDVCTILHACNEDAAEQALIRTDSTLHSAS
ncbi:Saposin B domain-containing protein isoform 1 [Dorcoceras hygrometricum]|uniref:Pulmonary surfactant-associated protein B n=1 Tax=Dorcoceras hygrometricum TaxID=472368 RepID=A0A2Z7A7A6_9LAMI|nr:Saposin B domain-containing protein isoform 1 [Dorcoceras hygrometricum]